MYFNVTLMWKVTYINLQLNRPYDLYTLRCTCYQIKHWQVFCCGLLLWNLQLLQSKNAFIAQVKTVQEIKVHKRKNAKLTWWQLTQNVSYATHTNTIYHYSNLTVIEWNVQTENNYSKTMMKDIYIWKHKNSSNRNLPSRK